MGLTASVSSASSASSAVTAAVSLLSSPGVGVGGVFVAAALVFVLGYLYMADDPCDPTLDGGLPATAVALSFTFFAIVAFKSRPAVEYLLEHVV